MRVEAQLHAVDAAVAGINDMTFPKVGANGLGVRDQLQVALGNAAIIDWRRIGWPVQHDGGNFCTETIAARKDSNNAIMVLREP